MPVYVEHHRPHNPSGLKRYSDIADAAQGISRSSHCNVATIMSDLRSRGRFIFGHDVWAIVTSREMRKRAAWAMNAADLMDNGEDVSGLPD